MNAHREHPAPPGLPDGLRQQLRAFRRYLWRLQGMDALGRAITLAGAGFIVVFVGDRMTDLPGGFRALLLAAVLLGVVVVALRWLWRWVLPHRSPAGLARFLQGTNPRQGDAVAAALDLADEHRYGPASGESPQLRAAALEQTALSLGGEDLAATVPKDALRRTRRLALAAGALILAIALIFPQVALNAGKRLAFPWRDTPRYTFAQLTAAPDELVVAENEPFVLEAHLAPRSAWRPREARAMLPDGWQVRAARVENVYRFAMPPLREPGVVQLKVGDARARISLTPLPRPGLTALEVEQRLPDYLQHPPRTLDARSGKLGLLPGSRLSLTGRISRALEEIAAGDTAPRLTIRPDGVFASEAFSMDERPRHVELAWKDEHGLANREPFRLSFTPIRDEAPAVAWREQNALTTPLLVDGIVALAFDAEDDYGVREAGMVWTEEGVEPEAAWEKQHRVLAAGGPQQRLLNTETSFSPQSFGLAPGRFRLWAYAVDYLPNRHPRWSEPLAVTVLDHAEHAAMLRADFEQVRRDLEEVARREDELSRMNKELLAAEEATWKDAAATLQQRGRDETRNAEALIRLRDEARSLFASAMKNRELGDDALAPWSAMTAAMTAAAESDMPAAARTLGTASSQAGAAGAGAGAGGTGSAVAAKASLQKAIRHQDAAMEKLAGSLEAAAETGNLLEAATFVNRLRRAAEQERGVAERSRRQLANTVGLAPSELEESSTNLLNDIGAAHASVIDAVGDIHHDLEHYAARSGQPVHRQLFRAMSDVAIGSSMRSMLDRVANNQAAQLTREARRWADQLDLWADTLGPGKQDEGGSGSGGGTAAVDRELLLALMRLVQSQTDLRERTRRAERARVTNPRHAEDTGVLATDQLSIGHEAAQLLARVFDPLTHDKLQHAGRAISDAVRLLQGGETGGGTIAAQTEVIEWLGQAGESSNGGAQESAGVEAMLEMMSAMQVGAAPGGNPLGQPSALAGRAVGGESEGAFMEKRLGDGASSRGEAELPEEFREAIGAYFQRVDALEAGQSPASTSPSRAP